LFTIRPVQRKNAGDEKEVRYQTHKADHLSIVLSVKAAVIVALLPIACLLFPKKQNTVVNGALSNQAATRI